MPFIPKATSKIAYLRFHGRNPNWYKASREERYHYLYSEEELKRFLPSIASFQKEKLKIFIFFNNCHAGFAVKNGLMLKRLLGILKEFNPEQEGILKR